MNQKYFIGIDISKGKLDCAVILSDYSVVTECIVPNNVKKINSFLKAFMKKHKKRGLINCLFVVKTPGFTIVHYDSRLPT